MESGIMFLFFASGIMFPFFVLFVLAYLIYRYIQFIKYERKTILELKRKKKDFVLPIILLILFVPGLSLSLFFGIAGSLISILPIGFCILFLKKRNKIFGEEIRREREERQKQREEKQRQKEEQRQQNAVSSNTQSSLLINRVAFLVIVIGFFIPFSGELSVFGIAKSFPDSGIENASAVSFMIYSSFITSLIGVLLFMPMAKKTHIGIDWTCLILSFITGIYSYSKIRKILLMADALDNSSPPGRWFILIGWIALFLALLIESITLYVRETIKSEMEMKNAEKPLYERLSLPDDK